MTIEELKNKGYELLNAKPYQLQRATAGYDYITIAQPAKASGAYYEAKDADGNILLVRVENMREPKWSLI
jgi:hypothetical protein